MKLVLSIILVVIIAATIQTSYAQPEPYNKVTYLGASFTDRADTLNITYYNNSVFGNIVHDGKVIDFDIPVSLKTDSFKARGDGFILIGKDLMNLNNIIVIFTGEQREKVEFFMSMQGEPQIVREVKTPTYWLEDKIKEEIKIDPLAEMAKYGTLSRSSYFETQKKLEEEKIKEPEKKIPRSDYKLSNNTEIKIVADVVNRIPYYKQFDFDVLIVDPSLIVNPDLSIYNDNWIDAGWIDDVEITSTIKDPNGKILNEFNGNTTNRGKYSPESETSFTSNYYQNNAYTLEVSATKYFDDVQTFATDAIIKEFFIYTPNVS